MGCDIGVRSVKDYIFRNRVLYLRHRVGAVTLDKFRGNELESLLKVLGLHRFEADMEDVERLENRLNELNNPDSYLAHNDKSSKLRK